ncbi:MAG: DUF6518 family protein [Bacillota bacterium]|nr:DUF6518 family protein [Bacillota bacterium]
MQFLGTESDEMNATDLMNHVRMRANNDLSVRQKICHALLPLALGLITGFLAKLVEAVPHFGLSGDLLNLLSGISTDIGPWVLLAAIIAAFSRTPEAAALHVFVFFAGMLFTYYLYSTLLFHFFPRYYFLRWGIIALVSPVPAFIVWFSRGKGWVASFCAALPVGLLITLGYRFLYTHSLVKDLTRGFDLFSAVLLIILLPRSNSQRLRMIPLAIIVFLIIEKLNIISLLFGGL